MSETLFAASAETLALRVKQLEAAGVNPQDIQAVIDESPKTPLDQYLEQAPHVEEPVPQG